MRHPNLLREMIRNHRDMTMIAEGEDGMAFTWNRNGSTLRVILSYGGGWDHVSVSRPHKLPGYHDMKAVKRFTFNPGEWAMELHPPASDYISVNDNVLHIWRPQGAEIPVPPKGFI